ncbi:MAG: divalent-cation tolerance protein CutA [Defluviicoccus sp.]|nr:MAG: divalent-cation tolerance protein CutA [Defluviicoccus sp.]
MDACFLYVTTASEDEALGIARSVVGERLAACANILGTIRSVFWWQDQVNDDAEVAMILKTRADLVPSLTERVKALHSYECPCVVALPIVGGNADFLAWIGAETTEDA